MASKVSDATAARLAHTLDRISPDTAHTAAVPAQTTPRKTDVREDLYARLGGTSPFANQVEAFPPSPGISKLGEPAAQKELPSRLHFAAVGGARTKLVKRRLTLFASRRRDKLRRALGRWQALSAACNARLASIETVEASGRNKAEGVALDEKEGGVRATLNLGHTFGHAIETKAGYGTYLHGEAVGIGMHMAAKMSRDLGWISDELFERAVALIDRAKVPIVLPLDTLTTTLPPPPSLYRPRAVHDARA